jgi:hypothetical protein
MARKVLTGAPKEDIGIVFGSHKVCITFPSDGAAHLVADDVLKKHGRPESVTEDLGYHALELDAASFACPKNHAWLNELMHAIATDAPAEEQLLCMDLVDGFANMEVANEILWKYFKEDWDASQQVIDAYAGTGALIHRVYAFGEEEMKRDEEIARLHPHYVSIRVYYQTKEHAAIVIQKNFRKFMVFKRMDDPNHPWGKARLRAEWKNNLSAHMP